MRQTPSTSSTDWQLLSDTIVALSKKHGQLKAAITKMVQLAMCFLKPAGTEDVKMAVEEEAEKPKPATAAKENGKAAADDAGKDKEAKAVKPEDKMDREGQEDQEVAKLMNEGRQIGDAGLKPEERLQLVETLRTVTEGKVSRHCSCRRGSDYQRFRRVGSHSPTNRSSSRWSEHA